MTLPNFAGVQLVLWNYTNPFFPSQWGEVKLGGYDWKAANATIVNDELQLKVTEKASGQVQTNAAAMLSNARWEVDVTLPQMEPGLIAAPLWTYNNSTLSEIDFEIVGTDGLQLTIWANVGGVHTAVWSQQAISGDMSGERHQLAIEYASGSLVVFFIDGEEVARVTPADTLDGHFPSGPQKPYFDLWVANGLDPAWAGAWVPLSAGEARTMILHGYAAS